MAQTLPEDILYLICDELLERRDFGTLYSCCTAGKLLAVPALTSLYRAQHMSTIKADSNEEAISLAEQQLVVQKWSILWRTVVSSAIGKTIMPYCKAIRVLDLDDLRQLFEDDRFRGPVLAKFFEGDLKRFFVTIDTPVKNKRRGPRLNIDWIVESIGDLLTESAPLLEAVTGTFSDKALVRWIPSLPNLRSLRVMDGTSFRDDRVPNLLYLHCPKLESIAFYMWLATPSLEATECDQKIAALFSGLTPHSLKSFHAYSRNGIGPETFLALNCHGKSLRHLDMQLDPDAIPHLGLLKACTALESLKLVDYERNIDLEESQNDVFLEIISWLVNCRDIKSIVLHGFKSGAAIITPVLLQEGLRIEHLEVDGYAATAHKTFHQSLWHQPSVQRLTLESEPLEYRDDIDILVHSLCQLKQLRSLKLIGVSAMFNDSHIGALSEQLEHLEDFYVGGLQLTDASLGHIIHLTDLRSMAFSGITTFTMDGLLNFISNLGPGNKGLVLAIDNADPDMGLSEEEQMFLRSQLMARVDGRLEYTFIRDPDVSEFEGESD